MIREFEFYHGLVFARILHSIQRPLSIQPYASPSNSSYVINDSIGVYVKYSTKRLTPWRFSFRKEHQDEIYQMKSVYGRVFLVLVCSDDGIVCLSYEELKQILDDQHDPTEWVSATRHPREMYSVKGSNGSLEFKVGASEFPSKLFARADN